MSTRPVSEKEFRVLVQKCHGSNLSVPVISRTFRVPEDKVRAMVRLKTLPASVSHAWDALKIPQSAIDRLYEMRSRVDANECPESEFRSLLNTLV
jgi:hypothetical protein